MKLYSIIKFYNTDGYVYDCQYEWWPVRTMVRLKINKTTELLRALNEYKTETVVFFNTEPKLKNPFRTFLAIIVFLYNYFFGNPIYMMLGYVYLL